MSRVFAIMIVTLVTTSRPCLASGPEVISADNLTDDHVRLAVAAIVEELYARKQPRRFWDPEEWVYARHGDDDQAGGYTALAVLALLYAGQSYQDPRLRDAIEYLERFGMHGTYAISVRTHVWAQLPPRFQPRLADDAGWLVDAFSETAGGWDYVSNPNTNRQDNSLRQYGALGWWEASKRGLAIEPRYWQRLEDVFLGNQLADGGWNYKGDDGAARGSMTTAGLAVLFITQDELHADEAVRLDGGGATRHQRALDLGMSWMDANFSATSNPGRDSDFYYYLYGVERVGLASGFKFFGGHDWFREGTAELIRRLCRWDPETRTMAVHDRVAGAANAGTVRLRQLCFALMFMSRGNVPAAINKLKLDDAAWNNRPRDVANLARWIRRTSERALNWQIVGIDADPEQWLDAPMLYLASDDAVPWAAAPTEAGAAKIRRYLDLGGLLFAVNEGKSPRFARSIEALGSGLYPRLAWRDLPDEHWAYTMHWPVGGRRPALRSLTNGVRDLIILAPGDDLAATFQSRDEERIAHYRTAGNIYFYASEFNRPHRRLAAAPPASPLPGTPVSISVVRATPDGAVDPEPGALAAFADSMRRDRGLDVRAGVSTLDAIDRIDPAPALVMVIGIDSHDFTDAEREAVGEYVASGGTVLFETPGGRGRFTLSAEQMATTLFAAPIRGLVRTPVITGEGLPGGARLTSVDYRPYALEVFGGQERGPRVRGMMLDGRPCVLFSREDISHGLLDQPCWGVSGYAPESARDLLMNMLLHAEATRSR